MIDKQPIVSFILPIYNVEKYLVRCIESIYEQDIDNMEIILVDDKSPDNCPAICDEYAEKDKRVKVIHKVNEGLGFARNSGMDVATGKYIYFVDSDDYLLPDSVNGLVDKMEKDNLDFYWGGIKKIFSDGTIVEEKNVHLGKIYNNEEIKSILLKNIIGADAKAKRDTSCRMAVWQGLYRFETIKQINLKFESERKYISEDIMFQIKFLTNAKCGGFSEKYVYMHVEDNLTSLTHKFNPRRFELSKALLVEEEKLLTALGYDNEYNLRAKRMFFGNVRLCLKQIVLSMNYKSSKKYLKSIVNDKYLKECMKEYPIHKNHFKQRLLFFFIKYKLTLLIYLTIKKGAK